MTKILIIEDDMILLQMYEVKFRHAGFDVDTAFDGEQGLEKIRSFNPDLVLLDILIPKINGKVLFERVRNNPEFKNLRIAILTNVDSPKDRLEFIRNGAEAYIVKADFTPAQVVEEVQNILSNGKKNSLG